jgi:hypothetical protein
MPAAKAFLSEDPEPGLDPVVHCQAGIDGAATDVIRLAACRGVRRQLEPPIRELAARLGPHSVRDLSTGNPGPARLPIADAILPRCDTAVLAALGLTLEPVRVDDDGPLTDDVTRVLNRGVRALIVTSRAQNPMGAALSVQRAAAVRDLLTERGGDLMVVEDDPCAGVAGAPLHSIAGSTRHWVFVRSAASPPGLRITISDLDAAEIDPLADAVAEAVHGVGRPSV